MTTTARPLVPAGPPVTRSAGLASPTAVTAAKADDTPGLWTPLRVTPEEAQSLQWLVPGQSVAYRIVTILDWQLL